MTSSRTLGVGRGTKSWSQKAILSQKTPAHILLTYWGGGSMAGAGTQNLCMVHVFYHGGTSLATVHLKC